MFWRSRGTPISQEVSTKVQQRSWARKAKFGVMAARVAKSVEDNIAHLKKAGYPVELLKGRAELMPRKSWDHKNKRGT